MRCSTSRSLPIPGLLQAASIAIALFSILLVGPALGQETKGSEKQGRSLFNGKDLTGWEGRPGLWTVEEGAITGVNPEKEPIDGNTFLVWKDGKVSDFTLTLEYRIQGGNSGIQYRSKLVDDKKFVVGGYQADIDSTMRFTGINYEERGRGIMAERGQIVQVTDQGEKKVIGSTGDSDALASKVDKDGWNRYRIEARGNKLQHYINDVLMSELVDDQATQAAKEGILALQLHAGPPMKVQFKNIVLLP